MEKVETLRMKNVDCAAARKAYLQDYVARLKTLLSKKNVDTTPLTLKERVKIQAEIKAMENHIERFIHNPLMQETQIESILNLKPEDDEQIFSEQRLGPFEREVVSRARDKRRQAAQHTS